MIQYSPFHKIALSVEGSIGDTLAQLASFFLRLLLQGERPPK